MHIILGTEAAERLKENYTVLELDTFTANNQSVTAFCVVSEVPITDLPNLEHHRQLHADFIEEYKKGNYTYCINAVEHLKGKFNGDMDSFYDIVIDRIVTADKT
jgi:hypothetical protein